MVNVRLVVEWIVVTCWFLVGVGLNVWKCAFDSKYSNFFPCIIGDVMETVKHPQNFNREDE
jgi:hypothetical protein